MALGALLPALLFSLPLAAAFLLYLYRRGGRGSEVRIPSVFLLKRLTRPMLAPRKIVPPPRFYLELLIALLLGAAASGLFLVGEGGKLVILIDNSLSMSAKEAVGVQAESRLAIAKREAEKALQGLSLASEAIVYTTSPGLSPVTQGFVSPSDARRALASIEPRFSADNVRSALERLLTEHPGVRLLVLSDQRWNFEGSASRLSAPALSNTPLANLALTEVRIEEGSDREHIAVIARSSFFPGDSSHVAPTTALLTLSQVTLESGSKASLGLKKISEQSLKLTPGESMQTRFPDVPRSMEGLRVDIRSAESSKGLALNALRDDDTAYLIARSVRAPALVVSDLSPQQLGLGNVKAIEAKAISPEAFSAGALSKDTPFVVLHRYVPPQLPSAPILVIVPPPSSKEFPSRYETALAEITRWLEGHPINSYVHYNALKLKGQSVLQVPGWAQEIASSTHGPLIYAGELDGRRIIVSGLELLPYEGRKSTLLSILTLNMVKWLTGGLLGESFEPTFRRLPMAQNFSHAWVVGDGDAKELAPIEVETNRYVVPEQPGMVIFQSSSNRPQIAAAINFFDGGESNLSSEVPYEVAIPTVEDRSSSDQSLVPPLLMIALLLFLLDSTLWLLGPSLWRRHGA